MSEEVKIGFELHTIQIPLEDLLPLRPIKDPAKITRYKTILISVKEVGVIEPLMVYPQKGVAGKYIILDGHLRWFALKELKQTTADCIVARDDECFTYNARVSRITPIQEHRMIVKAVNQGVPPERIAAALNIPVRVVKAFLNLLLDIHEEVADLLKDKNISPKTLRALRKVNGVRQVEIAELMVGAENYTNSYVEALILGTPKDQLAKVVVTKKRKGFSPENIARMEQEMATLERDFKAVEAGYGQNVLNLTLASAYIRKLIANVNVTGMLKTSHNDIFAEFEKIAAVEAL
jgi:ParB-like chromosome segregation protein Spo0J